MISSDFSKVKLHDHRLLYYYPERFNSLPDFAGLKTKNDLSASVFDSAAMKDVEKRISIAFALQEWEHLGPRQLGDIGGQNGCCCTRKPSDECVGKRRIAPAPCAQRSSSPTVKTENVGGRGERGHFASFRAAEGGRRGRFLSVLRGRREIGETAWGANRAQSQPSCSAAQS